MTNKKKEKEKSIARYAFQFVFYFHFFRGSNSRSFTRSHVWYHKIISVAKLGKIFSAHAVFHSIIPSSYFIVQGELQTMCHLGKHILHKREWSCKRFWHHDWNISRGQLHLQSCLQNSGAEHVAKCLTLNFKI